MSAAPTAAPFAMRTVLVLVALAVLGFLSFVLLSAYADELGPQERPGIHALSNGATGFSGIVRLARETGHRVDLSRRDTGIPADALLILTPTADTKPEQVKQLAEAHEGLTLIILPKWRTEPLPGKSNWVRSLGEVLPEVAARPVASYVRPLPLTSHPGGFRTLGGPVSSWYDTEDGTVLAEVDGYDVVILADPDLVDNLGLATPEGAHRAIDLLETATPEGGHLVFDLTLHGYGGSPNLIKLAFEAPFLPLTLCLLAAALLAGWHAILRFGTPAPEVRGIAFGKRAIAENGAALLRLARRRHRTGARYAALTREAVATATGAPPGLRGAALDAYLDKLDTKNEPFSAIAQRAASAPDTRRLLDAARALHLWRRTVTREH